jgi:hypothetical protein
MEVSSQLHAPTSLLVGESTHYTGGFVSPRASQDVCEEEKYLLLLPGIESQLIGPLNRSLVAIPTELCRRVSDYYGIDSSVFCDETAVI